MTSLVTARLGSLPLLALYLAAGAVYAQQPSAAAPQAQHETMAMPAPKPSTPSTSLTLTANGKTVIYTAEQLAAMPQRQIVVHNGHSNVDETYSGVGVDDLLGKAGFTLAGKGAQTIFHSYVRANGTDGYFVIFSMSELEPGLHTGDAIVAMQVDGKPLGNDGVFKMVLAGEKRPARWVHTLASLSVVTVE